MEKCSGLTDARTNTVSIVTQNPIGIFSFSGKSVSNLAEISRTHLNPYLFNFIIKKTTLSKGLLYITLMFYSLCRGYFDRAIIRESILVIWYLIRISTVYIIVVPATYTKYFVRISIQYYVVSETKNGLYNILVSITVPKLYQKMY